MKKIWTLALAMFIALATIVNIPVTAYAIENDIVTKTSTAVDEKGRFKEEIKIEVEDLSKSHDEVIVMVDGAYSNEDDWHTVRSAIVSIGKTMLEGRVNTLLTVVACGMEENIVFEHIESVENLKETLPESSSELLNGRSFTNCEAGFVGIAEYIQKHDETLNNAYIVCITNGEVDIDETEHVFYKWSENEWLKDQAANLAKLSIEKEYDTYESGKTKLSDAYCKIISNSEILDKDSISDDIAMAWADKVWADVYAYSGMVAENSYSISDVEKAFVKYDKENGTYIQEIFYYSVEGRQYPERFSRTYSAGIKLVQNEKVAHLYLVDSNSKTSWMAEIAATESNVTFTESGSVSNLLDTLNDVCKNMTYTPYNDIVAMDYTSKWVNLDADTIKIVDNYLNKTIWTSSNGWLIAENRPTSQEKPVSVKKLSTDDSYGPNLDGNESGAIYKITWYVKDGALLRNESYSLVYEVDVDTDETGFRCNIDYPANGSSIIEYTIKNGDKTSNGMEPIRVPNVIIRGGEKIEVCGSVKWNDENNKSGKRPDSVTINLMADGKKVDSESVTAKNDWAYSFKNKPKYDSDGKKINYTVSEAKIANYTIKIDGYNITNTYVKPESTQPVTNNVKNQTISISGTIAWMDEGNKYGKRPESVTINLKVNGTKVDSTKASAETNWTYSFKNMAQYDAQGKKINYTVSENSIEIYVTQIDGYNIVNTIVKPETFDIIGTVTWEDENNVKGKRPESINVRLYADDEFVKVINVTKADDWKFSFTGIFKSDFEGNAITYTIVEDEIADYQIKIDGYNIINTYEKQESETSEIIVVSGVVSWNDNNDKHGKRPEKIIVNLKANGESVSSVLVTEKDSWKYTFNDLPLHDQSGKKIIYTVTEDRVANYTTKIKGYDIENTYKRSIINIPLIVTIIFGILLICMLGSFLKNQNRRKNRRKNRNRNSD